LLSFLLIIFGPISAVLIIFGWVEAALTGESPLIYFKDLLKLLLKRNKNTEKS
jgi:hypothetical protein